MWSKTEFCEIYLLKQNFYLKKLQTAAVAAQEGGACGEVKGAGEGEWKGRGSVRGAVGQSHFF